MNTLIFSVAIVATTVGIIYIIWLLFFTKSYSQNSKPDKPERHNNTAEPSQLIDSFTPDKIAFFIKTNGLYLIDNGLMDEYPQLTRCKVQEGMPCLCSAALFCLYCLANMEYWKSGGLDKLEGEIENSYPDVHRAWQRALYYFNHFDNETLLGLMQISGSFESAYLYVITQWLLVELTMGEPDHSLDLVRKILDRLSLWFHRIPPPV